MNHAVHGRTGRETRDWTVVAAPDDHKDGPCWICQDNRSSLPEKVLARQIRAAQEGT